MKKLLNIFILLALTGAVHAQLLNTYCIDFGPNDGVNGNSVSNPDANNSYWNNITNNSSGSSPVSLVTSDNTSLGASLQANAGLSKNGILNGGLQSPPAGLGELAIEAATEDYFFVYSSGSVTISGLNPDLGYQFAAFGSRNTPTTRISIYHYEGANEGYDTLQTSGTDLGGSGVHGNNSTVTSSDVIRPTATGEITVSILMNSGGYGYINCLKVEEVEVNPVYLFDLGPNDVTNGNNTSNPDANGLYWNNFNDPSVSPASLPIKDKFNQDHGNYFIVTTAMSKNGLQNGGLTTPTSSLDEMEVGTATQDYFFTTNTGQMQLGGLKSGSGFVFTFFGSRNTSLTRETKYEVSGDVTYSTTLQTSGTDLGGSGYHGNNSTLAVTDTIYPDIEGRITIDLSVVSGGFAYLNCMKVEEIVEITSNTEPFSCESLDPYMISYMGSSVAYGVGATNSNGYRRQYNTYLADEFAAGNGSDWTPVNISVPGNNTSAVINRFGSDLVTKCGKYVIYGLSLSNEGIMWGGQTIFDQFEANLTHLVDSAKALGMVPVVMNCYSNNNYNATDYQFIKDMNMLIHSWDVPSVNLLGGVDDETGKWASGHYYDSGHPNDAGHTEFFYTMVPSLFEALNLGKVQPALVSGTFISMDKSIENYQLEMVPDHILHSFTHTFEIKTTGSGKITSFETSAGNGDLSIAASGGALNYSSPASSGISGATNVKDGNWHTISLTHYYALGKTLLYVDGSLEGSVSENIVADKFILSDQYGPDADYRDWFFHRAGMNSQEMTAMHADSLLKSSLELYAPLDGQAVHSGNVNINLAQSLDTIVQVGFSPLKRGKVNTNEINIICYPNPANEIIHISSVSEQSLVRIHSISGVLLSETQGNEVRVEELNAGTYVIEVIDGEIQYQTTFLKE